MATITERRTESGERRYSKTAESERRTVGEVLDRYLAEILPTKPGSRSQRA